MIFFSSGPNEKSLIILGFILLLTAPLAMLIIKVVHLSMKLCFISNAVSISSVFVGAITKPFKIRKPILGI